MIASPREGLASCFSIATGKQYVELPEGLCKGYTDHLFGERNSQEYSGVICDRQEGSYIFLQRLIRYTPDRKAVWKIVQIQSLAKLNPDETALIAGCTHLKDHSTPVFAIVKGRGNDIYTTLRAWEVNLAEETFETVDPKQVICRDPISPVLAK